MLDKNEFENWIKASHTLFEIFEGRYDAYPLSVIWVKEWLDSNTFKVTKDHINRISALFKNFNYNVFGVTDEIKEKIDPQIENLLKNLLKEERNEYIGLALAPYLFTWNFQRFKEYYKREKNFNLIEYFLNLSNFLIKEKRNIGYFKEKQLLFNQIDTEKIEQLFHDINNNLSKLGINQNEPVGTIKLIHAFTPHYFPLIDNNIAKTTGLLPPKWESLASESYLKWMNAIKKWLQNYEEIITKIEHEYNSSILKLIDEGLYMMITVNQRKRVTKLGIGIGG